MDNISEAKIRNAIWYLKIGKSKKFVCDFLELPYNVKKLDKILTDFRTKLTRENDLKEQAKRKQFTEAEKLAISKSYLSGETLTAIATQYFITPARVKKFLIETSTPIRGRGKHSSPSVSHIEQNLELKFKKNDKVFIAKNNCFGIIDAVYDEEYLDFLEQGYQKYVEVLPASLGVQPREGVHYEIYWQLNDGSSMKLSALQALRNNIIKTIEQTGREFYRVWKEDEYKGYLYVNRDQLYLVRE